jgi:hypothetical protein
MFDAVASRNAFMRSPKIWPSTLQMDRRSGGGVPQRRPRGIIDPLGGLPDMQPCGVATSKLNVA